MTSSQFRIEVASAYSRIMDVSKKTGKTPFEIGALVSQSLDDDPEAKSIITAALAQLMANTPAD